MHPEELTSPPRVLISYSRESADHDARVLALAQQLRQDGVDAWIDRFEPAPAQGWPRWMRDQIEAANFVVMVCTPTYRRRFEGRDLSGEGGGLSWEGMLATQLLHDGQLDLERLVPVGFDRVGDEVVPAAVRGATRHALQQEYPELLARLTRKLAVAPLPLGRVSPQTGMAHAPTLADELAMLHEEVKRRTVLGEDLKGEDVKGEDVKGEDVKELRSATLDKRQQLQDGLNLVKGDIESTDGGKSFGGTMTDAGEGPIGFEGTHANGYAYAAKNQWGGSSAPWHRGGQWVLGCRSGQFVVEIDVTSPDGGKNLTGTMTYSGEGSIGLRGVLIMANTYEVENQWGGSSAPWHPGGQWVIGCRGSQGVVAVKAKGDESGLEGTMTYAGEGPIGLKLSKI